MEDEPTGPIIEIDMAAIEHRIADSLRPARSRRYSAMTRLYTYAGFLVFALMGSFLLLPVLEKEFNVLISLLIYFLVVGIVGSVVNQVET